MAKDQVQDVNSSEGTDTTPSGGDQTASQEGNTGKTSQTDEFGPVPYQRFREANEKAKLLEPLQEEVNQLRKEIETYKATNQPEVDPKVELVKEQLKNLGFVTKDEQEAELKRREEDARVASELSRLETSIDGSDGRPKFERKEVIDFALKHQIGDLEAAYEKLHRDELIDWHVQQAIAKSKGIKTEASDGSGSSQVGATDSDLKEAIRKGDKSALRTYLKRFVPKTE